MKYYSNVKEFAKTSGDLYDAVNKYAENMILERKGNEKAFSEVPKTEMEDLINKEFSLELEKQSGIEVIRFGEGTNAIRKYANMTAVKEFANDIKDVVIDAIFPQVLMNGVIPFIADVKTADFGGTIKFKIDNGSYFTVSEAGYRKRHANVQQLFDTVVTMTGANHVVTTGHTLFEILNGDASFAKDAFKTAVALESEVFDDAYDAFTGAMAGLSGNLSVANYSEASLITLCETVTAYNGGAKAVILGTASALKNVLPDDANYRYLLTDDYVKLGHVKDFNGYDVIPMNQVAKRGSTDYSLKLDDTEIYVVSPASDKIVKLGLFGGTYTYTDGQGDTANKMLLSTTEKAWEVKVVTNSVAGIVESLS